MGGGAINLATGLGATVAGGAANEATGEFATIVGGVGNEASGAYSVAMGRNARATQDGSFVFSANGRPTFSTDSHQFIVDASGGFGIGTEDPQASFHVSEQGLQTSDTSYTVQFDNTKSSEGDVLKLTVGGTDPGNGENFIAFFDEGGAVGQIDGDGQGGVSYKSSSADVAEVFEKANPAAAMPPGTVVGLTDGQLTLATDDADRVLVVSTAPLLLGNAPGGEVPGDGAAAALLGQVPVRVTGPVAPGDVLVASGRGDGVAVALPAEELPLEDLPQVVGQAMEAKPVSGPGTVEAVVGATDLTVVARLLTQQATRAGGLGVDGSGQPGSAPALSPTAHRQPRGRPAGRRGAASPR